MTDTKAAPPPASIWPGFSKMPVQLFPATLGFAGLALAWQQAGPASGFAEPWVAPALLVIAGAVNVLVFLGYALNTANRRAGVGSDMRSPASLVALASWPMSLMLLAAGLWPLAVPATALIALWLSGAGLYTVIAALFVVALLRLRPPPETTTPGWFVPTVGMAVAPSAGVALGFDMLSTAMALIGLAAWLVLLPLVVWRLLARGCLPAHQLAGLFVLIAPPALFSTAAAVLAMDAKVTELFFYLSCAMLLPVIAVLVHRHTDIYTGGFSYAWWSATFPLAALAAAAQKTLAASPTAGHQMLASGTLALATAVTTAVGLMTLRSIAQSFTQRR